MVTWYAADTPAAQQRIKGAWVDAPVKNAELLGMLLTVARGQVLAFAPAVHSPAYEPARVEWPTGESVTLTREGEIVTAYVDPLDHLALPDDTLPFPADHFKPFGTGQLRPLPASNYLLTVWDGFLGQPDGLTLSVAGLGPFEPGSVRWLAEAAPGDGVPVNYVLAQLMQVRNLWNAGRTTGDGEVGAEGFTFRPYPLDNTIKAVIRPIDWKPDVF